MATEKFTLDESMAEGWQLLGQHFWTYTRLASLAILLMFLPDLASMAIGLNSNVGFLGVLFLLLGIAMKGIIPMGLFYIQVRMINGQPVSSDDFWKPAGKYWAFVGASLIYIWVVAFGLLCFIVPGIIFGIMFQFFPFFIVEHRLGPIQSLKASAAITSGAMWELLLFGVLLAIIQGIAGLFFIFGAIPAQVFAQLTVTRVYKTLLNNTPPGELPFPYHPDTATMKGDLNLPSIADGVPFSNYPRAHETGDSLTVRNEHSSPQFVDAVSGDSSSQHHAHNAVLSPSSEQQSAGDHANAPAAVAPADTIVSNEGIGYDEPAKGGDQMDTNPAQSVDNRSGENDKTANEF